MEEEEVGRERIISGLAGGEKEREREEQKGEEEGWDVKRHK